MPVVVALLPEYRPLLVFRGRDGCVGRWRGMLFSNGAKTAPGGRRRNGVRPLSSLVEHFLGKEEVVGPIPTGGSALRSDVVQATIGG